MKKTYVCILLLLLILFSACGGNVDDSEDTGTTTATMTLPDNFFIDIDSALIEQVDTAYIITADRVVFDPETAAAKLMRGEAELTLNERKYSYSTLCDSFTETLTISLSISGQYGGDGGKLTGFLSYVRRIVQAGTLESIYSMLNERSPFDSAFLEEYLGGKNFENISFEETKQTIEGLFSAIGIPTDSLTLWRAYSFSEESQKEYISNPELYHHVETITEEMLNTFSDGYAFFYRQYFDGIPVNNTNWCKGILDDTAPEQYIYASLTEKDIMWLQFRNILTVAEKSEARPVLSYEEALEKLVELYSGIILTSPKTLMEAELCYAIYYTDDAQTVMLYPIWVFMVGGTDGGNHYNIYTFNAFTGERIVGNTLPE